MEIQEKAQHEAAIKAASRSRQLVSTDDAEIDRVFKAKAPNVMIQAGLTVGDAIKFHGITFGVIESNKRRNEVPALTATVTKLNGAGVLTSEPRVIYLSGLLRQDPKKGLMGLMGTPEFIDCVSNKDFADKFIAAGVIKVQSEWADETARAVKIEGVMVDIKNRYLELVKEADYVAKTT